jgi:hypothetical protein
MKTQESGVVEERRKLCIGERHSSYFAFGVTAVIK